jgi:hypothetical protein
MEKHILCPIFFEIACSCYFYDFGWSNNCDLKFIGELRMLNTWSFEKDSKVLLLTFGNWESLVLIWFTTSTLAHLWGMTCELDCVCFNVLGEAEWLIGWIPWYILKRKTIF